MKNFDSRVYSINDFVEWDRNNQLELTPQFQRRSVWSDNARSYLMDTIISGKPIPKVFIREKLNPTTKVTMREVVDGQQRLRTILAYVKDGFVISKKHNKAYGGYFFSQLPQIDEYIQSSILKYEISVDLLSMNDSEVLDVFSRLNAYSVPLNGQEKINAEFFGPFKLLCDNVAHKYYPFWIKNGILTQQKAVRMADVRLVADIYIAMLNGIQSDKQILDYYKKYENNFEYHLEDLENKFDNVMNLISQIFGYGLINSEFKRLSLFYCLFLAIYHQLFGLPNFEFPRNQLIESQYTRYRINLEYIDELFDKLPELLNDVERTFIEFSRRATTDSTARIFRTRFVSSAMFQ